MKEVKEEIDYYEALSKLINKITELPIWAILDGALTVGFSQLIELISSYLSLSAEPLHQKVNIEVFQEKAADLVNALKDWGYLMEFAETFSEEDKEEMQKTVEKRIYEGSKKLYEYLCFG